MFSLTSPIESPYTKLPAYLKLAILCVFTAILMTGNAAWWPIVGFASVVVLHAVPGMKFLAIGARRLFPLLPFLLVVLAWHGYTGEPAKGFLVALKLVAVLGLANLVTMTTPLDEMIVVAEVLFSPFQHLGLNPRGLGLAIALVIRFTPVFIEKGRILGEAWRSRSRRRAGWRIVVPLAAIAIDDAEHVAEAIRARGGMN